MYVIGKRFCFSASHQLDHLPAGHQCARLHGHNYQVEVLLAHDSLDSFGMVADFGRLDPVRDYVDQVLDHRHLNEVLDGPATSEYLAWHLYEWCRANLDLELVLRLHGVRVAETDTSWAEYRP